MTNSFKIKVMSDSLFLTVSDFLMKLKGLIFIPIAVKFLGLEYYGVYVQILANVTLIAPLCQFSLGQAFYRYTSKYDSEEKDKIGRDYWSVLTITIFLSCLGSLILFCLGPLISERILGGIALDAVLISSFLIIIDTFWSVNNKFIQSRGELKLFSVLQIIYDLVRFVALIAGIVIWRTLFAGLALYLAAGAILNLLIFSYILTKTGIYTPSIKIIVKYMKLTVPLTASSVSIGLLARLDRYFIGYFWGPATIGIYSIIYSICQILEHVSVPFTKYFQIYVPKLWDANQIERVKNQLRHGLKLYLAFSVGPIFLLAFLSQPLISWLLGKNLSHVVNFEYVTLLVGFGVVTSGASNFFYHLSLYWEKPQLQLYLQIIGVIANGILNYFLIKEFNLIGAGLATLISYMLIVVLCLFVFKLEFTCDDGIKISAILASGFAMMLILNTYVTASIMIILLKGTAAAVLYLSMIFAFRVITVGELKKFWT